MKFPAYPKYKDSGVPWLGEVPEHWEVKRLRRLTSRVTDGAHVSPDLSSDDYPFVSTVDIKNGQIDFEGCLRTSTESFHCLLRNGCKPFKGDVLFSKDGTVGRTTIVKEEIDFIVASSLVIITPKSTELNAGYLNYFLNNALLKQEVELLMAGAALRRISIDKVGRLSCLFPSLTEQTAIADFLDREMGRIDTLVAKKRRLMALLGEKRTALISRTVTRGLPAAAAREFGLEPHTRFKDSGIEWLGEVPEGWEVVELRRFIRFITSGSRGWAEHYADEGKIFVRIGNLTRHSIDVDLSDIQYVAPPEGAEGERTVISEGDVLFSITAYIGSVAVATEQIVGAYINQHIALVRLFVGKVFPRYIAYAALSDSGQAQLGGQGYGGTKVQLALDDVKSLRIPVPPLPEQTAIATYLDRETTKIDQLVTKVEAAIVRLLEYRTALITAAVTGKIDVRGKVDGQRPTQTGRD
jgi:type I restriction enzyme S subunit